MSVANIKVTVQSNAEKIIPKQVIQGAKLAQRYLDRHPLRIKLQGLDFGKVGGGSFFPKITREAQQFDHALKGINKNSKDFAL